MSMVAVGQLPEIQKPDLPGYVTTEKCSVQVGVLQKKWDDHVPVMVVGAVALTVVGYFIGRAMR